jgi:para-nitrobenzyl esterase
VEGGIVRGLPATDPRITSFKGVPFAAPPVGANRWKAPQPVIIWEGEKLCAEFAPIAMQAVPGLNPDNIYTREWHVDPDVPMDEDCLYLNIWTPAKDAGERLPVYVWYFGGGLQVGYPSEMEFDGERLARRGIVVVTINYRVNVFGFLAHPQLTIEQPDAPTNFGHLDQQAATHWVKRNISSFGGDPDSITIGGQSAGGGSVCAQLASPQNVGLFQRAIIQSGMFGGVYGAKFPARAFSDSERQGVRFFEALGVSTLEEARAVDAVTVRDKCVELKEFFGTNVDGKFLVENSTKALLEGRRQNVPLMITRTTDEFPSAIDASDMDAFRAKIRDAMGKYAEEFISLCGDDIKTALIDSKVSGLEISARALAAREAELKLESPIFYGVFDGEIPGWDHPGTFHSVDLWFYFETLAKCWRPFTGKHLDLARNMCNYWANFIKSGDPNGEDVDGTPMLEWKPMNAAMKNAMWFTDQPEPREDAPDVKMKLQVSAYIEMILSE